MTEPKQEAFFVGEFAVRAGVKPDMMRYYESEDRRGVSAFVGQTQLLGLTLAGIAEILDPVDDGEPYPHVRARLSARLEETRSRMRSLRPLDRRLEGALAASGIEEGAATCRCPIIEGVAP